MRMRVVILRVSHASIVPAESVSLNPRRAVCSHSASIPPHSASSIRGFFDYTLAPTCDVSIYNDVHHMHQHTSQCYGGEYE